MDFKHQKFGNLQLNVLRNTIMKIAQSVKCVEDRVKLINDLLIRIHLVRKKVHRASWRLKIAIIFLSVTWVDLTLPSPPQKKLDHLQKARSYPLCTKFVKIFQTKLTCQRTALILMMQNDITLESQM